QGNVRIRRVAANGLRNGLHDELFHAVQQHVEMAFELSGDEVRVGWRSAVPYPTELHGHAEDDGDGDGKNEHVHAHRSSKVARFRLWGRQTVHSAGCWQI